MNEELKKKLREMLEQYDSDLNTMWYNEDSGAYSDLIRKRQEEIAGLLVQLDLA